MKLALGTVQFGMPYGIANSKGQVTLEAAKLILQYGKEANIDTLDTAIGYGDSEITLGKIGVFDWEIITKLPEIPESCRDVTKWINQELANSLDRLKIDQIRGLMLHSSMQLLSPFGNEIWDTMQNLKTKGSVKKIGFSIYDPIELDLIWEKFQPDIIQAPYNIFDQRLKTSGWLEKISRHGKEVHVRSIFLQGLLLMKKEQRPEKFNRWDTLFDRWDQWLIKKDFTSLEACLGFVSTEKSINKIVIGVDSPSHLKQIIASESKYVEPIPKELVTSDLDLLNPSNWVNL
jgi:aryl-alcohol dehydrogenase-like predicted oxidoreductase